MLTVPLLLATLAAGPLQVEQGAPLGGDGSAERPFARVADALAAAPEGATLKLGPGLYEEQLEVTRAVSLLGAPGTVLAAPPGAPFAVRSRARLGLQGLTIQGGRTGLEVVASEARLVQVELRGQADAALSVASGAHASLAQGRLVCSIASALGARVEGELALQSTLVEGPFRRALQVERGTIDGKGVTVVGAGTGVHAVKARVSLAELELRDVRDSALFGSASTITLREVVVRGGEVGLEIREGTALTVLGGIVVGARRAAIASVEGRLTARDLVCVGPFQHAAVELVGGTASLAEVQLVTPGEIGVLARLAKLQLARVVVQGARAARDDGGNALFLFDTEVQGAELLARGCEGPAVEAQLGGGRLASTRVEQPGIAGVALEHEAALELLGLDVDRSAGAGLACIEKGRVRLRLPRLLSATPLLVDTSCSVDCRPKALCPAP